MERTSGGGGVVARDGTARSEDHDAADVYAGAEALHAVEKAFGRASEVDARGNAGEREHADAQRRVPRGPFPADVHVAVDHAGHHPQPIGIHNLACQ